MFKSTMPNEESKPRWAHDGSLRVNDFNSNITGNTSLYSVSKQKVLYAASFTIISNKVGGAGDHLIISDGPGPSQISLPLDGVVSGDKYIFTYPVPLIFLVGVSALITNTPDVDINFSGWEEDRG